MFTFIMWNIENEQCNTLKQCNAKQSIKTQLIDRETVKQLITKKTLKENMFPMNIFWLAFQGRVWFRCRIFGSFETGIQIQLL